MKNYHAGNLFEQIKTKDNTSNIKEHFWHSVIGNWLLDEKIHKKTGQSPSIKMHKLLGVTPSGHRSVITNPAGKRKRFGANCDLVILGKDTICYLEIKMPGCKYEDSQKVFYAHQAVKNFAKEAVEGVKLDLNTERKPVKWLFVHIGDKLENPTKNKRYTVKSEKSGKYSTLMFLNHSRDKRNPYYSTHTFKLTKCSGSKSSSTVHAKMQEIVRNKIKFTIHKLHIPWEILMKEMPIDQTVQLKDFLPISLQI